MDEEDPHIKENEKLSKELKIKTVALEILTLEYEKVKDKVRKYRAQKNTLNSSSNASEDSESFGKLISEIDEAKSREAILMQDVDRLHDILKEYELKIDELQRHQHLYHPGATSIQNDFDEEKVSNIIKENF